MTSKQIIDGAIKVLLDPVNWTKGALARDDHGVGCTTDDPRVRSFCMWGAISHARKNIVRMNMTDEDMKAYDSALVQVAEVIIKRKPELADPHYKAATCLSVKGLHAERIISKFNDNAATTHADIIEVCESLK